MLAETEDIDDRVWWANRNLSAMRSQSGNVFRNSSNAMAAILNLHFPRGSIIDVNYGHGIFYKKTDRQVIGIDVRPTGDVIADNRTLPFADDSFDLGVIDPPYKRGNGNARYTNRYGNAPCTEPRVTRSYLEALPELLRVSRIGIIVKCQDASDGHRIYLRHVQLIQWMKTETGLDPHDIAVNARESIPGTMAQGVPRFLQQGISYFLIYKWRSKDPYRPLRF